jgi:hypothetical protein
MCRAPLSDLRCLRLLRVLWIRDSVLGREWLLAGMILREGDVVLRVEVSGCELEGEWVGEELVDGRGDVSAAFDGECAVRRAEVVLPMKKFCQVAGYIDWCWCSHRSMMAKAALVLVDIAGFGFELQLVCSFADFDRVAC